MDTPALSVVIVIGSMRQRAARCLLAILEQKTRKPIQVIVVDTQPSHPRVEGADAQNVVYTEYPDAPSFAFAKLSALPRCSSEFVAFVEDHAFVEPGWAEGVIKGFRTGATVVLTLPNRLSLSSCTPQGRLSSSQSTTVTVRMTVPAFLTNSLVRCHM